MYYQLEIPFPGAQKKTGFALIIVIQEVIDCTMYSSGCIWETDNIFYFTGSPLPIGYSISCCTFEDQNKTGSALIIGW